MENLQADCRRSANIAPVVVARSAWLPIVCMMVLVAVESTMHAAGRYAARFENGERIEGDVITDWHETAAAPRLQGRELFAAGNPMTWLRDRSLSPPALPPAFVEFVGGDRLPGKVIDYQAEDATSYDGLPSHFVVEAQVELAPSHNGDPPPVRVLSRFVRRIVFERRGDEKYSPGTIIYRDGRTVECRSLRVEGAAVQVLLDDGPQRIFFGEIAELHFPQVDAVEAYLDELAVVCPHGDERLLQVETTGGLIATASLARFTANVRGNPRDADRWLHGLQPAWSLDALWSLAGEIWLRRSFAAHQPPLSRFLPAATDRKPLLAASGAVFRIDRNVRGGPLRSNEEDFGFGFGVPGGSSLTFDVPPLAVAFRSSVGLDDLAGDGGCIKARVFLNDTGGEPTFESGFLVGTQSTIAVKPIDLPAGTKQLILQIDAAHEGRPAGADPLDIRDLADWLDPVFVLDEEKLLAEIEARSHLLMPAWRGWRLAAESATKWRTVSTWDQHAGGHGAFITGATAEDGPIRLRRAAKLKPRDKWLIVVVERRASGGEQPRIEVRLGGETAATFDVPQVGGGSRGPSPLIVSLAEFERGRPIEIDILQTAGRADAPIYWKAIRIAEQLPTVIALFEDEGPFARHDEDEPGEAVLFADDRHSGAKSVKVTPTARFRRSLQNVAVRRDPSWGEFRYIRFAFRKVGDGRVSIELNHAGNADRPARYDAGLGPACRGKAARVWVQRLPNEWIVMTRDLYADFGELDARSLLLEVPDGEHALFDHIYLARSIEDFDRVPALAPPDVVNEKAQAELLRPLLDKVLPFTVAIDLGDGRFATGTIISAAGDVLTAGHCVIAPDRQVTVILADGTRLKAKTRGVYRDRDLGMIKIEEQGEWTHAELGRVEDVRAPDIWIGVTFPRTIEPASKPRKQVIDLRREFRTSLWTSFATEDFCCGGPLFDGSGRLIGVHSRESQFGGFLYTRLDTIDGAIDRMKNGDVWDEWRSGAGPMIGVGITSVNEGCKITEVVKDSPADMAGLQVNDIIQQVEGRSVVSLNDIDEMLADNDPDQQVDIRIIRRDNTIDKKLPLIPRVP